ncbi:gephyrin-like molybdotransferase Glp [uncultured Corynebacterium sp.]|uniref:molybdotransferase-like divisome protein Glp n=1 Tax=uncultured Corynebacterium sp. TaxID=159447 RepID=UPI0025FF6E15|nr:gephyrin-like molybdotransferase Glp [uncultured Corynebacterium sp.]
MKSVEEQLAAVTAAAVTPEPVRTAISEALGLRCAEQVESGNSLPGFNQAAVDGFAVRAVDIRQILTAGPMSHDATGDGPDAVPVPLLPVVGEVTAGSHRPVRLQPRQAVRVQTGAPLPTLADAVLPLDWATQSGRRIEPLHGVRPGQFVHRAGSDVQPGDVVVEDGAVIGAAQVGLLAAVGRSKVLVYPRPRVSVLSFGPELVDIDRDPALGQVFDVNSYALAAAGREAGADVNRVGVLDGEPRRLREIVESQLIRSEILVIAGGVGGASSDRLRSVLGELGDLGISRVAMHPGSVQGFGTLGADRTPTFLLPGNPSAALVSFEVLVRPLIQILRGRRQTTRRTVQARTIAAIDSAPGRTGYLRGQLMRDRGTREYLVDPLGAVGGGEPVHLLASHGQANCLVVLPGDRTRVEPGEVVDVMFLANRS